MGHQIDSKNGQLTVTVKIIKNVLYNQNYSKKFSA